jgi:hypothetical protein
MSPHKSLQEKDMGHILPLGLCSWIYFLYSCFSAIPECAMQRLKLRSLEPANPFRVEPVGCSILPGQSNRSPLNYPQERRRRAPRKGRRPIPATSAADTHQSANSGGGSDVPSWSGSREPALIWRRKLSRANRGSNMDENIWQIYRDFRKDCHSFI